MNTRTRHARSTRAIAALAARDLPLAVAILKEAIRIPADYVDRPVEQGGDPAVRAQQPRGAAPRVPAPHDGRDRRRAAPGGRRLRRVRQPGVDARGPGRRHPARATSASSTWTATATRCARCAPRGARRPAAARPLPRAGRPGAGRTASSCAASWASCRPTTEWEHLVFGRGSADQLGGVVVADRRLAHPARAGARGRAARRDRARLRARWPRRTTTAAARCISRGTCCPARRPSGSRTS